MKRSTLISIIIALSLLGMLDAGYLAQAALAHTPLACSIAGLDGCNTVAQSPYSHVFGIPLGIYGIAFYAIIAALALASFFRPSRGLDRILFAASVLGALASLGFLYVQLAVIGALCVYCLASGGISLAIFVLAAHSALRNGSKNPANPQPAP